MNISLPLFCFEPAQLKGSAVYNFHEEAREFIAVHCGSACDPLNGRTIEISVPRPSAYVNSLAAKTSVNVSFSESRSS